MVGTTPRERARVRELERIAEIGVLSAVAQYFQNTHPFMASRFKQSPEAAENAKTRLAANLKVLDAAIGAKPFVAGERSTIADCTLSRRSSSPSSPRRRSTLVQERGALVPGVQGAAERGGVGPRRFARLVHLRRLATTQTGAAA